VKIDTGRTHQIRVHMSSLGHPVVGDKLYGAPRAMRRAGEKRGKPDTAVELSLERNFLHAAELELKHPRSGEKISLKGELPPELREFLERLEAATSGG
jgi:23S rRNA pseudouridine1911/1915/1917 synthase